MKNKLLFILAIAFLLLGVIEYPAAACVVIGAQNLHTMPGVENPIITPLHMGQILTMTGHHAASIYPGAGIWIEVKDDDLSGWVNQKYCYEL